MSLYRHLVLKKYCTRNAIIFFVLFSTLSFVLFSCESVPSELKLAERLIETDPDSALLILTHIDSVKLKNVPSQKALYGLLLFKALDAKDNFTYPDSILNFSINYYQKSNDKMRLAQCYLIKGHQFKYAQRFDEATVFYLKALDLACNNEFDLLGKIYADLGTICGIQQDYNESLKKLQLSCQYYKLAENETQVNYRIIEIGRTYRLMKKFDIAHKFYTKAISHTTDSMLVGFAFQEMGINYYWAKNFDSAEYYLRKSLRFPRNGTGYAVRCYVLADLFFDTECYDSAYHYAAKALEFPANFGTQRECYRILANTEYLKGNLRNMAKLMTRYQDYSDSIRIFERQSKCTLIENLHDKDKEVVSKNQNITLIIILMVIVIAIVVVLLFFFLKSIKARKAQLNTYKLELSNKQEFVNQNICRKITEMQEQQAEQRKTASPAERERLDRELYEKCLHLSNWEAFSCEMNHAFNNIVETLVQVCPRITRKEIIWCCLHLLNVPNQDRMLILDATADSLYKLKQRLAQKLGLKSAKDVDTFLKELSRLTE